MRGRSSSKQGSKGGMEIDKLDNLKEEPHLSGAYIRSLVKQLTSTRTKDPLNSKDQDSPEDGDGIPGNTNLSKDLDGFGEKQQQSQPSQQPQQHKKQVRRRLHASRPYQERLLNMAEARREIVTALKFHRAAMKQANEQQQQQQHQQQHQQQLQQESELQPQLQPLQQEQEGKSKSRRNPRIYESQMTNNFTGYVDNLPCSAFACPPNNHPYYWPLPPVAPPLFPENFNFVLPNQPLGLNLNLQDFNDLDRSFYQSTNIPSIYSSTSSSSTSSPPLSVATEEVPSVAIPQEGLPMVTTNAESSMMNFGDTDLHHAMDDQEMAEIRSIGEQHQMEWNDTLNLVTSAWWFKFLKTMEIDPEEKAEEYGNFPFDEVMEFPSWLNANESCLEQHLNDYCFDDYMQDPALPCMEIEEIEGMDGEWLS
ncbi:uncharacterized protein [Coffea arabica]|uniref:Uncharacterized protein n=1 Tax=Coffea arabica TaxID=13443 RepID=A0A6P6TZN4_COFAR